MPNRIVLATANPHKVAELRAIFAAAGVDVLGLDDLPGGSRQFPEPEETGTTFEQNASIKALAYSRMTGEPCLADDSGLEIDALGGRPGVISSHYSTDGRETGLSRADRDAANNARVLDELRGVAPDRRAARFVCVMAIADRGSGIADRGSGGGAGGGGEPRVLHVTRGVFDGRIGVPPRVPAGRDGFGYDPLFLVAPEFSLTGAELAPEQKNRLSHRAAAAAAMAAWLKGTANRG